jgi:hypothetical protein
MELTEIYKKLDNLFNIEDNRELTDKEEKELSKLKKLRNKLDPDWMDKL